MKTSYFSINEEGVSIRSKFYGTDARTYKRIVIFSHGFGGHKDNPWDSVTIPRSYRYPQPF